MPPICTVGSQRIQQHSRGVPGRLDTLAARVTTFVPRTPLIWVHPKAPVPSRVLALTHFRQRRGLSTKNPLRPGSRLDYPRRECSRNGQISNFLPHCFFRSSLDAEQGNIMDLTLDSIVPCGMPRVSSAHHAFQASFGATTVSLISGTLTKIREDR